MKRGFTLIELLVVVVIIAILAAVAVPQYNKAVEKSRMSEAITLLEDITKAEKLYLLETGTFTFDLRDLIIDIPGLPSGNNVVSSVDSNYYTFSLADEGARVTALRKGDASQGPSVTYTLNPNGTVSRYCNDSTARVKICDSVRSGPNWEAGEYVEETQGTNDDDDNGNEIGTDCRSTCGPVYWEDAQGCHCGGASVDDDEWE